MSKKYRRKNNKCLNIFFTIILLLLIGILCYKLYTEQTKPQQDIKTNKEIKEIDEKDSDNEKIKDDNNEESKKINNETVNSNEVTTKSSSNENRENKNEQKRRGSGVTLELIGEENINVKKGTKYKDEGVKAYYSDGSDATSEVDVDNAVDTSKTGTYTVTYYIGNSVVIRRVTVE